MIICQLVPISQEREASLRKFLHGRDVFTLLEIGSAQVKRYQADALKDAIGANPTNQLSFAASANMAKAVRYQDFVEVLQEFIERNEPFQTAKLT